MKKLSKSESTQRDDLSKRLEEAAAEVSKTYDAANAAIQEANSKIEAYNSIVEEANSFREGIAENIQSYVDDRSEKWQESDKASSYSEWHDQWSEELETLETFEELEEPTLDHADTLNEKASEVEG